MALRSRRRTSDVVTLAYGTMSDDRLRRELVSLGFKPGPITDSTRGVLQKKLEKLRRESAGRRNSAGGGERRSGAGGGRTYQGRGTDSRVEEDEDEEDEEEQRRWETHRSDLLPGLHRPQQLAEERVSWGRETRPVEGSWGAGSRAEDVLYPRRSVTTSSPHTEHSGLWRRDRDSWAADYNGSSSLGWRPGSTGSLPHTRTGGLEQGRARYGWEQPDTTDSRPHTGVPALRREGTAHHKPHWARCTEYYLAVLLRVLCAVLLTVFLGILVMKSGVLSSQQDSELKLLPTDCEGRKDSFCKAKEKQIVLQILSELYDFLSIEAGRFECGNPSGLSSKCVPINRAKEHVMNVSGYASMKFDAALDWMLTSDVHLGIWAKGEDAEDTVTKRADIFCVESSRPRLGITCRMKNALYTAISNLFLAVLGIFFLWLVLILLRYHWRRLEEEEKQMFDMVEKIIDAVKYHYKDWTLGIEQNAYVGILHVRDTLIMPQDRKRLKKVWDRAVQFIEDNESRLRTESQRVAGADLRAWRWTHSRSEYPRERMTSPSFLSSTMRE
ncbi:LEM domain-containing protein 2 [Pseudophryne corroboree]|uniref:LEM domain-containing protein 2 n=1 Tax=Pseudophryne corroboree TaxID=495146 RepID=UPI0030817CA3